MRTAAAAAAAAAPRPSLPGDRMHQKYLDQGFAGGGGLFSVIFGDRYPESFVAEFANALKLFGMGYSWGGYESLVSAQTPKKIRTASEWPKRGMSAGTLLRFNIGLEDPDDICADIDQALNVARGKQQGGPLGRLFGGRNQ